MATRGELLKRGAFVVTALAVGKGTFHLPAARAAVGYGPLGPADANGVRLPAGFAARLLAKSGQPVLNTNYIWPGQPDGSGTFPTAGGGWVLACNSELNGTSGGASGIRFAPNGHVRFRMSQVEEFIEMKEEDDA